MRQIGITHYSIGILVEGGFAFVIVLIVVVVLFESFLQRVEPFAEIK